MNIIKHLKSRGLFFQSTPEDELIAHLNSPRVIYSGFDPTAESLHVGHLLPIITLKKFKEFGHKIIPLLGIFTAQIGDPTGKSKEREMLSEDKTRNNAINIAQQLFRLLGEPCANNIGHENLKLSEFLSITKEFNVRRMLGSDCFANRLAGDSLSLLEMTYMVFQAQDFVNLNKIHGCTVQIGGSDQWSNMIAGIDLLHNKNREGFCITCPLFVDEHGRKMGKTESNPVWLDRTLTTDFEFFQFWRNLHDNIVPTVALQFTDIPVEDIPLDNSNINAFKERVAFEITKFVRGEDAANNCLGGVPEVIHLTEPTNVLNLIIKLGLVPSNSEGRKLISNRGIKINGVIVEDFNQSISHGDLLTKGKNQRFGCKFYE